MSHNSLGENNLMDKIPPLHLLNLSNRELPFNTWVISHKSALEDMYDIFMRRNRHILNSCDFSKFCYYIYKNSSKTRTNYI